MPRPIGRPRITADQVSPETDPRGTDPSLSKYKRAYWRDPEKARREVREAREKWSPERREHQRAVFRAWYRRRREAHPEPFVHSPKHRATVKAWRDAQKASNPELVRLKAMTVRLKSKYGLTIERYDAMFAAQGGVCAVCKQPETIVIRGTLTVLGIDHDHDCCPGKKSCGKCIRGLLCNGCNRAAGVSRDNPARLRALADYIEAFREGQAGTKVGLVRV